MTEPQAEYKVPRISEHEEQASFIAEVHMRYASRDDFISKLLFAVPNGAWFGGKNPHALMAKYRKEGFKNGVADLIYLQPRGPYSCLCIEFKAQDQRNKRDGGLSPDQVEFLAAVNEAGGCGDVCYGAEHAMIVFDAYMSGEVRS
jgi:hypothetical protein